MRVVPRYSSVKTAQRKNTYGSTLLRTHKNSTRKPSPRSGRKHEFKFDPKTKDRPENMNPNSPRKHEFNMGTKFGSETEIDARRGTRPEHINSNWARRFGPKNRVQVGPQTISSSAAPKHETSSAPGEAHWFPLRPARVQKTHASTETTKLDREVGDDDD